MGVHFSNTLSEIVESVADCQEDTDETVSSEDWLAKCDEFNQNLDMIQAEIEGEKGDKVVMGDEKMIIASDIVKMFPSMDAEDTSKAVEEEIIRSRMSFSQINVKETQRYLAMTATRKEIKDAKVEEFVPRREHTRGPAPGITGEQAKGIGSHGNDMRWNWETTKEPGPAEKE